MKWFRGIDRWISLGLFTATFTILCANAGNLGITRDEGYYFDAAERYAGWWRTLWRQPAQAFDDEFIRRHFEVNREHPVLMKNLMALSFLAFHPEPVGGWPPERSGAYLRVMRLPAELFAALAVVLVFWLGRALASRKVGLFAAAAFLLAPRHFFHAQLACLDMPVCAMWLGVVLAYRKSFSSLRWAWLTGLCWGLAISTKHNAWFLPTVLLFHWLLVEGKNVRLERGGLKLPKIPWAFVAMLVLGPAVFFLHWPLLWRQTCERVGWYFSFHLNHINYPWEYFGKLLVDPPHPWLYPFAVTALTLPIATLVPAAVGFFLVLRERLAGPLRWGWRLFRRAVTVSETAGGERWFSLSDGWLILLNAFVPLFLIAIPSVPIFGGMKHWLQAMPFICVLGGRCLEKAAETLPRRLQGPGFSLAAGLAVLGSLLGLLHLGNFGTSYYNELAGGVRGAADLGMQRQYWSNNVSGVLGWLNENLPQGARLFLHEVNAESFRTYQRDGLLRPDLRLAWWTDEADFTAYQYHREFVDVEYRVWNQLGHQRPVYGLYIDEVPIITIYDQRKGQLARRPPGR